MSDTKTAKKTETKADKKDKSETKSDTKSETGSTGATNKSASQTSISHFSSVTTKEYRSGWEEIFGKKKNTKKAKSKKANGVDLPLTLDLSDEDIKDDLRALLYKAFQRQTRKDSVSLAQLKKIADIEYSVVCDIREKSH